MSIQTRAMIETIKVLGIAISAAVAVMIAMIYIPLEYLGTVAAIGLAVFFAKMVYDINLNQLKSQEILNKLNSKE